MTIPRRMLLRRGVLFGSVGLAGCSDGRGNGDEPGGTEELPTRFWLEEASISESEREAVDPIAFGDLSETEREIVRTALEDGEYTAETGTESPAFEKLRDRIAERTDGGRTLDVYLQRDETFYRVGFADGDHVIAHPDH